MPVVQFLRDCGYHVVEAASTDEAITILQNTNTPVDVVLSEIDIPGSMNGFGSSRNGESGGLHWAVIGNSENSKANRIETMKGPAESGQICSVGRRKIAKKIAKNK